VSEIEITLPTVQYGNVKVRATPEELGADLESPHSLGVALAVFQNLFTQGWVQGSQMDVSAPQGASQGAPEEVFHRAVETAQESAQRLLEEGLGATEVGEDEPAFRELDPVDEAPWSKPAIDAPARPWETGGW
jgi:hypothetical protein